MAGIGFELRKLRRQETISSLVASAGYAAVIAAGPWLFTILSLAVITLATDRIAGLAALAEFRAVIIYAFASSLVLAAPATIVATRLLADALWAKRPEEVRPLLLGAFVFAAVPVALVMLVLSFALGLTAPRTIAVVASSTLVGLIWVAIAFCGAVRDYRGVTLSFVLGLAASVVASVWLAVIGYRALGMVWGFMLGLTITLCGLTSRVLATFPHLVEDPLAGFRAMRRGMAFYWPLAAGALVGTVGVWIDKWLFWVSKVGEKLESGLLHAPLYDSTMFIASLLLIPSLAAMMVRLETGFFDHYQRYYATVRDHGTLNQIEAARVRLAETSLAAFTLITVSQVGLTIVLVLTAPIIVDALGLQFRQIAILRYGAMGSVFQFVFIAATSLILFFDRRRVYLALQVLFLIANGGLTVASLVLGEDFYGTGYFLACLLAGFTAFLACLATFERLNFLTFLGNNPSIVASSRHRPRWVAWRARTRRNIRRSRSA